MKEPKQTKLRRDLEAWQRGAVELFQNKMAAEQRLRKLESTRPEANLLYQISVASPGYAEHSFSEYEKQEAMEYGRVYRELSLEAKLEAERYQAVQDKVNEIHDKILDAQPHCTEILISSKTLVLTALTEASLAGGLAGGASAALYKIATGATLTGFALGLTEDVWEIPDIHIGNCSEVNAMRSHEHLQLDFNEELGWRENKNPASTTQPPQNATQGNIPPQPPPGETPQPPIPPGETPQPPIPHPPTRRREQ